MRCILKSLNYEEIDLLWEILNFKIIAKNNIYENYKIFNDVKDKNRKLNGIIEKFNKILIHLEFSPSIEKSKEFIYYNSKSEKRKPNYKDKFIYRDSIRREMIQILLLLNRRKFSIARFIKDINKKHDSDRKHIRNDLKIILENYHIKYEEYIESLNPTLLLEQKIKNLSELQHSILKNILIKRWEKIYENNSTMVEYKIINFICNELEIKNITAIYEEYLEFLKEYNFEFSKNNEYEFFTYLILNLNNRKINIPKRVKKNDLKLKDNKEYELMTKMLKKISRIENIKIYTNFKMKLYKQLLKIEKSEGRNRNRKEIFYENFETIDKKEVVYRIAEDVVEETNKKYKKIKKEISEVKEKINILLVLDMESIKYIEYKEEIKSLFLIFNIINIISMGELKKEVKQINYKNLEYDQILLISDILVQNMVENLIDKPIYFINLKQKNKNKIKCKKDFLKQIIESNNITRSYQRISSF